MNADMLNRGTEYPPPPRLSLSLGGGERLLPPPLDPPLVVSVLCVKTVAINMADMLKQLKKHLDIIFSNITFL